MTEATKKEHKKYKHHGATAGGGAVYGLGIIGALIYYVQHATSFALVLLGIIKAVFWPAFVVYKLLEFLHM